MANKNRVKMLFPSSSENVGIARVVAAAFAAQVDLTLSDLEEIKVAVSEAVSNAVIHGYGCSAGEIEFEMTLEDGALVFVVTDFGKGIADIALARQPSYSTDPERMGLGFVFMESFMDELIIESEVGKGTTVRMLKQVNPDQQH
ncbi:MAG: anti-sigma F factor [Negativicutes bacterium]|nr:anti-sigma F factor [Negativicutes bacterium]